MMRNEDSGSVEADNLTDPNIQFTRSTHFMAFWLEGNLLCFLLEHSEKHGYRFLSNLSNSASCSQHQKEFDVTAVEDRSSRYTRCERFNNLHLSCFPEYVF